MKRLSYLFPVALAVLAALFAGCGSTSNISDGGSGGDVYVPDGGGFDGGDVTETDGGMFLRHFTFRSMAGVSMGASGAGIVGAHHPELFDNIGPLGGYINFVYLGHMIRDRKLGGFCPMAQLLDHLPELNQTCAKIGDTDCVYPPIPDQNTSYPKINKNIWCGPVEAQIPRTVDINGVPTAYKYEHVEDYDHWFFFNSGGDFDRDDHREMFQDLSMALGNAMSYNDTAPFLVKGLTPEAWNNWSESDPTPCVAGHMPVITDKTSTCNAEFNPECNYQLVAYCEGDRDVDDKSPDYWKFKGLLDPTDPPTRPLPGGILAAVDYNGNGVRDYGEPVIFNGLERFDDTGTDGCFDKQEAGAGKCCSDADAKAGKCTQAYNKDTNPDPNGDDFNWDSNAVGAEGNWLWDEGERYDDFGLDGVKADPAKGILADYGEGNGKFDYSPTLQRYLDADIGMTYLKLVKSSPDVAKRLDMYIDGGIRDIFNSGIVSLTMVSRLRQAGINVKVFDNYFGYPTSIDPVSTTDYDYQMNFMNLDYSRPKTGQVTLMLYGKPNATHQEILDGDGAHVGTTAQAVQRFITFIASVTSRWPKSDRVRESDLGKVESTWFFSKNMNAYRRFVISLPPGYEKEKNRDKRYPVVYLMHGYGMNAMDFGDTAAIFNTYMAGGDIPKTIVVFPEGACCFVNHAKGVRQCACDDDPNNERQLLCVQNDGKVEPILKSSLDGRECNRGSFYADMVSDRFGSTEGAKYMKYEGSILDLIDYVDQNYRTRLPEDIWVKQ